MGLADYGHFRYPFRSDIVTAVLVFSATIGLSAEQSPMRCAFELTRRRFLHLMAAAVAQPALPTVAVAQSYPTRPVRLIVGQAAGSGSDIIARLIGQWLSERLGQPFVVENRPGAGGNIGTEAVVRAAPDGNTLLLITSSNAVN